MQLDEGMTSSGTKTINIMKFNAVKNSLTMGLLMAAFVFIILLFMLLFGGSLSGLMGGELPFGDSMGTGILVLIAGPLVYFVFGFLSNLLMFSLFNLISKLTGGFEFTLFKK